MKIRNYDASEVPANFREAMQTMRLMRMGCIDLTMRKYLAYDDDAEINRIFDEQDRRFAL